MPHTLLNLKSNYISVNKQYSVTFLKALSKFLSQISKMDKNPTPIINRKKLWKTQINYEF